MRSRVKASSACQCSVSLANCLSDPPPARAPPHPCGIAEVRRAASAGSVVGALVRVRCRFRSASSATRPPARLTMPQSSRRRPLRMVWVARRQAKCDRGRERERGPTRTRAYHEVCSSTKATVFLVLVRRARIRAASSRRQRGCTRALLPMLLPTPACISATAAPIWSMSSLRSTGVSGSRRAKRRGVISCRAACSFACTSLCALLPPQTVRPPSSGLPRNPL